MYYNYYQTGQYEFDECITKGICSINPTLSSLQEVILLYMKELAFYILKLKEMGVSNRRITEDLIDTLSGIVANIDYNQEQFQEVITKLYNNLSQAKSLYVSLCQKHNLECQVLKSHFKHSKKTTLTESIRKGEKYFLKRTNLYSPEQKNLFDIMLFLVKSICTFVLDLESFGVSYDEAQEQILIMLSTMNFCDTPIEDVKKQISKFIGVYYELVKILYRTQVAFYGEIAPVEVSLSTRPGKAIMVSGSNLKDLETILELTKDKNIDVYTHGVEMIMAHTFPKLRAYPNLIGHFGKGAENCLLDYATFPGSILMTKHSLQKVEYLYRGRLFTTDAIAPKGVVKIKDNNFEHLIKSAKEAKGFSHGQQKNPIKVGFNEKEVLKNINKMMDKVESEEIKHIFVVGLLNYSADQQHYFEKFLDIMPNDCFAISLSYEKNAENVMHIDSFYDFSLIYKILKEISLRKPLKELDMSVFLTKCDKHTVANILNLKNLGIKDIYMCKCSPNMVNPALITALRTIYNIKEFANPEEDLAKTLIS